ncbi:MAG TPA: HAMP domain-containing sensor histidine kinase [Streptosporangiaceae bacterium]|nr:HAMP domain-containing sensor histidine kinase [Streptosporangiaceae bacterium]
MRRRLAVLVSATMALVLIAFVVPLAAVIRVLAADRAMTSAASEAQQLSAIVATAPSAAGLRASAGQVISAGGRPASVFLPGGQGVLGDPAPQTAAVRLARQGISFTAEAPGGRQVLTAVGGLSGGTVVVRVFVSAAELTRGVTRAWLILAGFGLVLLALGVLAAGRLVTTVTRPIGELARVSHRLAGGDLDARAGAAGPPEVREVAHGLNHLAGRIRDLIWQERESVADLSHRLRTPLTALRLETEALPAGADPQGRLADQVQALERAVTSLIDDARRGGAGPSLSDAAAVVSERAAFWSVLADDQGRAMNLEVAAGPVPAGVAAADLAAAMDALLGNVFAHTPEGTPVTIRLRARDGGGAVISVEDRGPGFPAGDPVARGASGGGSTGLGLDIARQAAEASGGSLSAGPRPAGTGPAGARGARCEAGSAGAGGAGGMPDEAGSAGGAGVAGGAGGAGARVVMELGPPAAGRA